MGDPHDADIVPKAYKGPVVQRQALLRGRDNVSHLLLFFPSSSAL